MSNASASAGEPGGLYAVYSAELRLHAVGLVWLGYQRLNVLSLVAADEDVITGELVREMKNVLEDAVAPPPWAEHYSANEQQRANVPGKLGKNRPIIDVEFERHCRGKRPRLRFEAKRLRTATGTGEYLGEEGLAAFLSGYYPTTHAEAGMLGYVQEGTPATWAQELSKKLMADPVKHRVTANGQWQELPESLAGAKSYQSSHADANDNVLAITHMLLAFAD